MSEYTAKRARTRSQLLSGGQEMLPGSVRRGLEHALGPGPVAQRAGLSRQTWYRYWRADDSGFLDELTRTALRSVHVLLEPVLDQLRTLAPDQPEIALREIARAHFGLVTHRRVALIQLLVATLAVEDQFLEAESGTRTTAATPLLKEHDARLRNTLVSLYGPILEALGRRPRPPFEFSDVMVQIVALADGFAVRHISDPDLATPDRFADAVEATVLAVTELSRASV